MATKNQQYTGRLYTQAEVDRIVREARIDELKDIDAQRDHNMSYLGGRMSETDADNLATSRIKDRIVELSQTLKEHKD